MAGTGVSRSKSATGDPHVAMPCRAGSERKPTSGPGTAPRLFFTAAVNQEETYPAAISPSTAIRQSREYHSMSTPIVVSPPAGMIRKTMRIGEVRTSIKLEPDFWSYLKEVAEQRRLRLSALVNEVASATPDRTNLASTLRTFALVH